MITTYDELKTAIATWLNRTDLTAVIPDFISLAEEKFNRQLRIRDMEVVLSATTIASNRITPASNVLDVKTLWVTGYEATPLAINTFENVLANGQEGIPTMYAWQGGDLYFDGAGDVEGVLYESIPALSDSNTSNWLLQKAPSVYLFGSLLEAAIYTGDDPSIWQAKFDACLNELTGNDKRYPAQLTARARR